VAIGGLVEKISAAVAKGCDTIIIAKDNSSEYHSEVP
jgi:ATP-dependent Lon protease